MKEKKSFGVAFLFWLFLGFIGGHRIYIKESVSVLLWYWFAAIMSLTLIVWIDLFLLKGMIEDEKVKYGKLY